MINIMNEYVSYGKKSFTKYMKMIFGNKFDKKINDAFLDTYINIRYSNYLDESTESYSLQRKLEKGFDNTLKELSKDEELNINDIANFRLFYSYIYNLEQLYLLESQKKGIQEISQKRLELLNVNDEHFVHEFSNILRDDIKKRKDYLDSFESDTFSISFSTLGKNKNNLKVDLKNNIKFPDLYSDVAIKRVGEKDKVSEDLAIIGFLQLTSLIVNDLIVSDFDKKYYIDLPSSFFDKKTKLNKIMEIIDNVFVQDKIRIVISFACFIRYKSYVMQLMRNGFVFALFLDDSFDYCSDNLLYLETFDKILLYSSKYYYKDMINNGKIGSRVVSIAEVK